MAHVSLFRLYSVQVIREHERLVKVVVLCPWVDEFLGVASWPSKVKKTVGQYIGSWAAPERNWTTYEIVERFLETGTKEEAAQVHKFSTEEDSSDAYNNFLADGLIYFYLESENFEINFHS